MSGLPLELDSLIRAGNANRFAQLASGRSTIMFQEFAGLDLSKFDFSKTDFNSCKFINCTFPVFGSITLLSCSVEGCVFEDSPMLKAEQPNISIFADQTTFENTKIRRCNIGAFVLRGGIVKGLTLKSCRFFDRLIVHNLSGIDKIYFKECFIVNENVETTYTGMNQSKYSLVSWSLVDELNLQVVFRVSYLSIAIFALVVPLLKKLFVHIYGSNEYCSIDEKARDLSNIEILDVLVTATCVNYTSTMFIVFIASIVWLSGHALHKVFGPSVGIQSTASQSFVHIKKKSRMYKKPILKFFVLFLYVLSLAIFVYLYVSKVLNFDG